LKSEPIVSETPEKTEVAVEAATPAAETLSPAPVLPKTASQVPLIGLLGVLSVSFAFMLKRFVG
jgi:hypothetical protein